MSSRTLAGALLIAVAAGACGGDSGGPTQPSPQPGPATFTLSGTVTDTTTGRGLEGASVVVVDGANANKSALTDGAGHYTLTLTSGGFTARATRQYYTEQSQGVTLTANTSKDFALTPVPPFSRAGTGDNVFDLPTMARLKVEADYTDYCQNFIVDLRGRLLVNVIVGQCDIADSGTHFEGVYQVNGGGVVEITKSTGVHWRFTEVR